MNEADLAFTSPEIHAFHAVFDGAREVKLSGDRVAHRICDPVSLLSSIFGDHDLADRFLVRLAQLSLIQLAFQTPDDAEDPPTRVYDVNIGLYLNVCDHIIEVQEPVRSEEELAAERRITELRAAVHDADEEMARLRGLLETVKDRKKADLKAIKDLEALLGQFQDARSRLARAVS